MLGSMDCMPITWKKCPAGWNGHYKSHCEDPKIILEAVVVKDLWIWHAFFGLSCSPSDLNVLSRSPLFARLVAEDDPPCNYVVNGVCTWWVTILQMASIFHAPHLWRQSNISSKQQDISFCHDARVDKEGRRESFGVLKKNFGIIHAPAGYWKPKVLWQMK
jgi:hypothetical protein